MFTPPDNMDRRRGKYVITGSNQVRRGKYVITGNNQLKRGKYVITGSNQLTFLVMAIGAR